MGKVLPFVVPENRAGGWTRHAGEAGKPCEIVLLPCVRYERSGVAGKPPPQKRRKGRKRRERAD